MCTVVIWDVIIGFIFPVFYICNWMWQNKMVIQLLDNAKLFAVLWI